MTTYKLPDWFLTATWHHVGTRGDGQLVLSHELDTGDDLNPVTVCIDRRHLEEVGDGR